MAKAGRKISARLERRRKALPVSTTKTKFHMPGSQNRKK